MKLALRISNKSVRLIASCVMLLVVSLAAATAALAQTSVVVEVKVLQISRVELDQLGTMPAWLGFAKPLSREQVESITSNTRSKTVQRIDLQATSRKPSQLRVDTRISLPTGSSVEVQAVHEAGIGMDVTPKVFQNRDIALTTASAVRIRRVADANGASLVLFESPAVLYETRVHEGETIAIGGFITDAQRMSLPELTMLPDNPILNYLFPKTREQKDRSEIVVLLTPRIVGIVLDVPEPVVSVAPPITAPITPPVEAKPLVLPPTVADVPSPAATQAAAPAVAATFVTTSIANTPATPAPAEKEAHGVYTVQVGAFDSQAKAQALMDQLSKKFDNVFIDKVSTGPALYHVRVGHLVFMEEARQLQRRLTEDGFQTYVTTLDSR
ncbi:MAG TPA: SPOR domain-containing protein [Terriglobia bacterium]|nr:SPOR domain-containing protein [Terriglobia bacterium]